MGQGKAAEVTTAAENNGIHCKTDFERATEKPRALPVLPDGIPVELKECPQWVCWRQERRNGRWTKVPVDPNTGNNASCDDPSTWSSFKTALDYYQAHGDATDGIGFEFREPYAGVDLDDCRDPITGKITPWGQRLVELLNSYTEVSPSGTGVKVYAKGKKPGKCCRKKYQSGEVEVYDRDRFFAVTGYHLEDTPSAVEERSAELAEVYHEVFVEKPRKEKTKKKARHDQEEALAEVERMTDGQLLQAAFSNPKNGRKIEALYNGDTSAHNGDASAADMALADHLAFYTHGDVARMDRLFRGSRLMRKKWDEVHFANGDTYGKRTLDRAVEMTTVFFVPFKQSPRFTRPNDKTSCSSNESASPPPDGPAEQAKAEATAQTGYQICLNYFMKKYQPAWRKGTAFFSDSLGRLVKPGEVCFAPGTALTDKLACATDAPRCPRSGMVNRNDLKRFFQTWMPSAYQDALDQLPDEEASAEVLPAAEEAFRDQVAAALFHLVTLGETFDKDGREITQTQRRPLLDWARIFAKKGNRWADVRGYKLWCRRGDDNVLQIALRKALFGQVPGCTALATISDTKFTQLCQMYGVGTPDRVKGSRAVILTAEFVAWLTEQPSNDDTSEEISRARV
jgi:hypothetical protein